MLLYKEVLQQCMRRFLAERRGLTLIDGRPSLSSRTGVTASAFKLRTHNMQTTRAYGDPVQRKRNANEPSSLICMKCTEVPEFQETKLGQRVTTTYTLHDTPYS